MSLSLRLTNFLFDHSVNLWGWGSSVFRLNPLVFRVRMTNRCNLSCHYCYVGKSLNQKVENLLTVEEWKKIIHTLPRNMLIDITGGEPFLTPHFDEILNCMLDKKLRISLITNGTAYKESVFEDIVNKKLSHFMISFDGPREIHDEVRGKGNFDKAIKSAQKIIDYKKIKKSKYPLMVAKITYTESNYKDIHGLISYLTDVIGFDGVTLNLLFDNQARDGFSNGLSLEEEKFQTGNTVLFNKEDAGPMANAVGRMFESFPGKVQVRPEIKLADLKTYFLNPKDFSPRSCHKYKSIMTMYSDGTITPCDLGLDIGNVRAANYDIPKSYNKAQTQEFFKKFKIKKDFFPGCQGCCLKKHESVA